MAIELLFNEFPILQTQRLTLRQMSQDDLSEIFALYSDDLVTQFIDIESISTKDEAQELLDFFLTHYTNKNAVRWAITEQPSNELIGTIGFNGFDRQASFTEIGYDLMPQYWRNGIMSEAILAVLTYGFNTLNLHGIEANVTLGNQASEKLLEKLGFTREGVLRDRMYIRGAHHSLIYYSLLQSEYITN